MPEASLKDINNFYLFVLTSYQSFSMALYDIDSLLRGRQIIYGLDGYDFCRFVLPREFFIGKPNPHHQQIEKTWETFFRFSDGETTIAVVSPLAWLEFLATIDERSRGQHIERFLTRRTLHLLEKLRKDDSMIENLSFQEKKVIQRLVEVVVAARETRQAILKGKAFTRLVDLMNNKKVRLLEEFMGELKSADKISALFEYKHKANVERGIRYLNDRRGDRSLSQYGAFYNLLDVYHYILFDNVDQFLEHTQKDAYISSSGILSRNSWFLIKLGRLPGVTRNIPINWAARSSHAPAFVAKLLYQYDHDLYTLRDFFEEARSLARVILRDLEEIPEMYTVIYDSSQRQHLLKSNPIVKVRNKILQAAARLQNDYLSQVWPEFKIENERNDIPFNGIDFEMLYQWMTNPQTRSKEFQIIKEQVRQHLSLLGLKPAEWQSYIAPLGDVAYDILRNFDPNVDM